MIGAAIAVTAMMVIVKAAGSDTAPDSHGPACAASQGAQEKKTDDDVWVSAVDTTGPGINRVTYMKPGTNIARVNSVKGKHWEIPVTGDYEYGMHSNMNAQHEGGGAITCKITKNGKVVVDNTSSGEYAIVTCN